MLCELRLRRQGSERDGTRYRPEQTAKVEMQRVAKPEKARRPEEQTFAAAVPAAPTPARDTRGPTRRAGQHASNRSVCKRTVDMGFARRVMLMLAIYILIALPHVALAISTYGDPCRTSNVCVCDSLSATDTAMVVKEFGVNISHAQELTWPSLYFGRESNLLVSGEYIYIKDPYGALQETHLDGYGTENFVNAREQIRLREGPWPTGPFRSRLDLAYAYLEDPSKGIHQRKWFEVWFTIEAFAVDMGAWTPNSYNRSIVTITRETGIPTDEALPQLGVARQNATRFSDISSSIAYVDTVFDEDGSNAIVSNPSVAGRYVVYSKFYPLSGRTHALLHDLDTGATNALGGSYPSLLTSSQLHARVAWLGDASAGSAIVFWVDTSASQSPTESLVIDINTTFSLLELPTRRKYEVRGSDMDPISESAQMFLWNAQLTATRLFLQVCNTAIFASNTTCKLVSCDTTDGCATLSYLFETTSGQLLRLHDASAETVLYILDDDMHVIVDARLTDQQGLVSAMGCLVPRDLFDSLVAVTLYHDTILGIQSNGSVFSFDLDKDNDQIIDGFDVFPYDGAEAFDSDNDGVGNKHDLVNHSSYTCASSEELGACTNDSIILYLCFAFAFTVSLGICRKFTLGIWSRWENIAQGIHYDVFVRHQEELQAAKRREEAQQRNDNNTSGKKKRIRGETYASLMPSNSSTFSEQDSPPQPQIPAISPSRSNTKGVPVLEAAEGPRDHLIQFRRCPEMMELKELGSEILTGQEAADTLMPTYLQKCGALVEKVMLSQHTTATRAVDVVRGLIDLFAVISVVVAFIPITYSHALALDEETVRLHAKLEWVDWYISAGFLMRIILERSKPDLSVNDWTGSKFWVEILALVTIPPGLKEYMTNFYFVSQVLRCCIVFRVARAYRRFFMEKRLVHVLINSPDYFLGALIIGFMIVCAGAVAQFEAESDPSGLADFQISLWFSAVTITTVGYGDYAPLTQLGRLLTIFMMIFGVGLVGTISGSVAKAIQTVGSTEEKVKQLKADNRARYEQYKDVFDLSALAYNPILMSVAPVFIRGELRARAMAAANKRTIISAMSDPSSPSAGGFLHGRVSSMWPEANFRRRYSSTASASSDGTAHTHSTFSSGSSSQHKAPQQMAFPINLGVGELIASHDGWRNRSSLSQTAAHVPPRRREAAMEKFLGHLADRNGGCPPKVRILLLLQSFQIDAHHKMPNFAEFAGSLTRIICEPLRQNDSVLEKTFALAADARRNAKPAPGADEEGPRVPDIERYSIADPLDEKLEKMEKLLSDPRYQLLKRVDFALLLSELTLIVLEFERLEMVQWAFQNLAPRKHARMPRAEHVSQARYNRVKSYISSLSDEDMQMSPEDFVDHMETEAGVRRNGTSKFAVRVRRAIERMKTHPHLLQAASSEPANSSQSAEPASPPNGRRRSLLGRFLVAGRSVAHNTRTGPGATITPLPQGMNMPQSSFHQVTMLARARQRIVRQSILAAENGENEDDSSEKVKNAEPDTTNQDVTENLSELDARAKEAELLDNFPTEAESAVGAKEAEVLDNFPAQAESAVGAKSAVEASVQPASSRTMQRLVRDSVLQINTLDHELTEIEDETDLGENIQAPAADAALDADSDPKADKENEF